MCGREQGHGKIFSSSGKKDKLMRCWYRVDRPAGSEFFYSHSIILDVRLFHGRYDKRSERISPFHTYALVNIIWWVSFSESLPSRRYHKNNLERKQRKKKKEKRKKKMEVEERRKREGGEEERDERRKEGGELRSIDRCNEK